MFPASTQNFLKNHFFEVGLLTTTVECTDNKIHSAGCGRSHSMPQCLASIFAFLYKCSPIPHSLTSTTHKHGLNDVNCDGLIATSVHEHPTNNY